MAQPKSANFTSSPTVSMMFSKRKNANSHNQSQFEFAMKTTVGGDQQITYRLIRSLKSLSFTNSRDGETTQFF